MILRSIVWITLMLTSFAMAAFLFDINFDLPTWRVLLGCFSLGLGAMFEEKLSAEWKRQ